MQKLATMDPQQYLKVKECVHYTPFIARSWYSGKKNQSLSITNNQQLNNESIICNPYLQHFRKPQILKLKYFYKWNIKMN